VTVKELVEKLMTVHPSLEVFTDTNCKVTGLWGGKNTGEKWVCILGTEDK